MNNSKYLLQSLIIFIVLFFLTVKTFAEVTTSADLTFPIQNPYKATLLATLPSFSKSENSEKLTLEIHPERQQIKFYENKQIITLIVKIQKNKNAPLMFIIPGLGGTSSSSLNEILTQQAYQKGYHTISLINPIHWSFVSGISENGFVGNFNDDVRDLLKLMKLSVSTLKSRVSPQFYSISGFSLGASLLPIIDIEDKKTPFFKFKQIIMLNPPISLAYGMNKLDEYYNVGNSWTQEKRDMVIGYAYNYVSNKIMDNPNFSISELDKTFKLSDNQIKFLIGSSFRDSLTEVIFTTEILTNFKILKSEYSSTQLNDIKAEAKEISYNQYLGSVLKKMLELRGQTISDESQFAQRFDFANYEKKFSTDSRFNVIHNENDFLLRSTDIEFLNKTLGSRFKLFNYGGHCGNYWYPEHQKYFQQLISF